MVNQTFQSVVYKQGKYFVAQCLDVDISSFGNNPKSALQNLKEALQLYFEDASTSAVSMVGQPTIHTVRLQSA